MSHTRRGRPTGLGTASALTVLLLVLGGCGSDARQGGGGVATCTAGTGGCECDSEGACAGDLACVANVCEVPVTSGLAISDESARACELILVDDDDNFVDVAFESPMEGQFLRRGNLVAVGFHQTVNEPIPIGAVGLQVVDPSLVELGTTNCYGTMGELLSGVTITLD